MRVLPFVSSFTLLLLNPAQTSPFDWGNALSNLRSLWEGPGQKETSQPLTNTQVKGSNYSNQVINNMNSTKAGGEAKDYNVLSNFLNNFGVELGTFDNPKIENNQNRASSRSGGLVENLGTNAVQNYLDSNNKLIENMLKNPDQSYDVTNLMNFPLGNVLGLLGKAGGISTNAISQNRAAGKGIKDQVKEKDNKVSLYTLVDLGVNYFYDNPQVYDVLLDIGVGLLKTFPFLSDVAFRVIAGINSHFNPELTKLALDFLYNYEKASTEGWKKLTVLITKFLQKDNNVGSRILRNLIALLGKNEI